MNILTTSMTTENLFIIVKKKTSFVDLKKSPSDAGIDRTEGSIGRSNNISGEKLTKL